MSSSVITRPPAVESGNGHRPKLDRMGLPPLEPNGQGDGRDPAAVNRWMWTWVTIGLLVILVVIGFLVAISTALAAIDDNLQVASDAVAGARGDVDPLPDQVEAVNGSLSGIDTALAPVPGQADQIIANLTSIRDHLANVDSTLGTTSASLLDTSSMLLRVRDLAGSIEATLESAESPADNLGASDIFMRVADANDILSLVKADTGNVLPGLASVNGHLTSICEALPGGGDC